MKRLIKNFTIKTYIKIRPFINQIILFFYKLTLPKKVTKLRRKEKINVLFLLYDISKWKSESLYLLMLENPRFNPKIEVTVRNCDNPIDKEANRYKLIDYLESRNYQYTENTEALNSEYDIILYQEPYPETVPKIQNLFHNLDKLFISICYSSHTTNSPFEFFYPLHFFAWFDCYENNLVTLSAKKVVKSRRNNIIPTGLPLSEMFSFGPIDPWIKQDKKKKRIIWAPHHTIGNVKEAIYYSTFLQYYDYMIKIAQKYVNDIQFVFKPHPLLRRKLESLWGREATETYYRKWERMPNTQIEYGDYITLFQTSDALIHDSSSFIIEYLYVDKPVMFLNNSDEVIRDLNEFGAKALSVAEKPYVQDDIEAFIQRIINGEDINKNIRKKFISEYLETINHIKASQNIIDYIITGNMK